LQDCSRQSQKHKSGTPVAGFDIREQPANGCFHFSPLAAQGTDATATFHNYSQESGQWNFAFWKPPVVPECSVQTVYSPPIGECTVAR
jgi:hypothetical protein